MPVISKFGILELSRNKNVVPNREYRRQSKGTNSPKFQQVIKPGLLWKKFLIILFLVSEFRIIGWVWIYNTFIRICIEVGQICNYLNLCI